MKTNHFFKLFAIYLLIFFSGCQEKEISNENFEKGKILLVNKKPFSEYKILPVLTEQLISEAKNFSKSATVAKANFDLYDFVIDSSKVIEVSYGNSVWYTMGIHRQEQATNVYENLVVANKEGEAPTAFLYRYLPDEAYLEAVKMGYKPVFSGVSKNIALNYNEIFNNTSRIILNCTTTTINVCGNDIEGGLAGPGCYDNTDEGGHIISTSITSCTVTILDYLDPGMSTISEEVDDSGNGGGGSGGANSGGTAQDPTEYIEDADVITEPILDLGPITYLVNTLNITDQQQFDFLIANFRTVIDINVFLESNDTVEGREFAKIALKALSANGYVDFNERLIFDNAVAERLLAAMSVSERTIYNNELTVIQQNLYLSSAVNAYIYAEIFYSNPVRNRKGDAVKHSMWNALSTSRLGEALTKKLTDAHEDITYQAGYINHFKETQMDNFNNAAGRNIGKSQSTGIFILIEALRLTGQLRYLSNLELKDGFYNATDDSVLIPTNQ